jgi:type I restriction enzyme S subunit
LIQNSRAQAATVDDEKVWSLNLDQIESGSGRVLKKYMVPLKDLGPSTYRFDDGTLLYSKLRPYLNKVVVADAPGYATTELVALRCDPAKMVPSFLAHYLRSPEFLGFANTVVAGAKMPRMVMSAFWRYAVPAPSLDDQHRIAAILDQADALRAKRREALAQLDSLTQSIFMEMFGDPVNNSKGWPDGMQLGDVAEIVSGVTKGRNLEGKSTRLLPYLAVANVQDKALNLANVKMIEATEEEIKRYILKRNDLLLTEGGDPDKLGRGTLWNEELPECIHQNHVFRVRLTHTDVTPCYLNWLIGSERGKKYFLRSAKQTTGIASINMTQLRGFPLLIPPLPLQQTFATRIQAVEALKTQHRAALTELDTLFDSLQHRAFQGAL